MYYNPMKRFIFICLFSVMGFAFAQTAESQTHFKNGLSLGAFWAFNQDKSGGDFEVGLPIIRGEETGFMLRNHFLFSGYGGDGFGQVSVGDKLLIGGYIPTTHFVAKPYGFVSTSLGFFASSPLEKTGFFSLPLIAEVHLGGGFEFQFIKNMSFAVEYGGMWSFSVGTDKFWSISNSTLSLGYRVYF